MSRADTKEPKVSRKKQGLAHLSPGHPIRVRKGKRTVGVLISPQDFMLFERLVAEEEDRLDAAAARKAMKEPGSVSLEQVRAELGL